MRRTLSVIQGSPQAARSYPRMACQSHRPFPAEVLVEHPHGIPPCLKHLARATAYDCQHEGEVPCEAALAWLLQGG